MNHPSSGAPSSLRELKDAYRPPRVPGPSPDQVRWFRDAKFGMFIHWGLYSLLGKGEWVLFNERMNIGEYGALAARFSADEFDPRSWARTAKAAGMQYMVFTARHHDGFALFSTKTGTFHGGHSAARRDFVAEYVEACRAEGLKVGLYYSPMDWRFPGYFFPELYFDDALAMRDQCRNQLRELMTQYGKIDLLWFDGEWLAHGGISWGPDGWTRRADFSRDELYFRTNYFWQSEELLAEIRHLQPDILFNNRFGWEGDFHVRERTIGGLRTDKPWDSNDCLARSWGWMPGTPLLSLGECIKNLVSIVVRDGNYLLNVGPTGEGRIEERQEKRLAQVGRWLEQHGKTLYGTRGGPFPPGDWGGTTYRGRTVFVHILGKAGRIELRGHFGRLISFSSPPSTGVSVIQDQEMVMVLVPPGGHDPWDTIVELQFESDIVWAGHAAGEDDIYGKADGL